MDKKIILVSIFLIAFKENFCSQNQSDEILSQTDTEILNQSNETASQPDTEILSQSNEILSQPDTENLNQSDTEILSFRVDWTAVKEELNRQGFIWECSESYTKREGCGTDQKFISFSNKFKKIPTWGLMALLNKKEVANLRV